MGFAYVFLTRTKKFVAVETKDIEDFDSDDFDPAVDECKKKLFKLYLKSGKTELCQITNVAGTLGALENIVNNKRQHVPKLNQSAVDEMGKKATDVNKDVNEIKSAKLQRAELKNIRAKASEETRQSILKAHLDKASNRKEPTVAEADLMETIENDEEDKSADDGASEPPMVTGESLSRVIPIVQAPGSEIKTDASVSSKSQLLNDLEEQLDKTEYWREKFEKLDKAKGYPLTERTGQQIVALLENYEQRGSSNDHATNVADREHCEDPVGTVKRGQIHLGDGVWVKKVAHDEIFRESENSKFITGMSYAIWGTETLARRVVRKQENVVDLELTPVKKGVLTNQFTVWLENKRKMPPHIVAEEVGPKKLHKYLNNAISGARKRLKLVKSKTSPTVKKTIVSDGAKGNKCGAMNIIVSPRIETSTPLPSQESPKTRTWKKIKLIGQSGSSESDISETSDIATD